MTIKIEKTFLIDLKETHAPKKKKLVKSKANAVHSSERVNQHASMT